MPANMTRVLCVDDNHDSADSTAELLSMCGCEAHACYDGESALGEAISFLPSVCFIDLNMPGMDGDEVARRIAGSASGRKTTLVALTAQDGEAARSRIVAAGFHLHLVKPADPETLIDIVKAKSGG